VRVRQPIPLGREAVLAVEVGLREHLTLRGRPLDDLHLARIVLARNERRVGHVRSHDDAALAAVVDGGDRLRVGRGLVVLDLDLGLVDDAQRLVRRLGVIGLRSRGHKVSFLLS
jgi:hypothetical protein